MSRLTGHPNDESLLRLAAGEMLQAESAAVSTHIETCSACFERLREIRTIRDLLHHAPTMPAPANLLSAALARRARGERVLLADDTTGSTRRSGARTRVAWSLATAATVLIAAFAAWPRQQPPFVATSARAGRAATTAATAPPAADPSVADNVLGALSPWPLVAYAQSASDVPEIPYPVITEFDTNAVQSGTRRYVRSSASAYHDYMPIDAEAIELRDTTYQGVRVWRVVTASPLEDSRFTTSDTSWIRKADMRLIARRHEWVAQLSGRESTSQTIRQRLLLGDTVLEQTTILRFPDSFKPKIDPAKLRYSTRTAVRPGHLLITDRSYFHVLVRSLPLHATWKGSIEINLGHMQNITPTIREKTRSINVSVQGDSVVSTLWGRVPSWRVVLHTGPNPERWYVSKEGHEVLLVTGPYAMNWPRNRFDLIGRYVK